jgi:hypothetical protein
LHTLINKNGIQDAAIVALSLKPIKNKMMKFKMKSFALVILMTILGGGCEFEFSTANVSDIQICDQLQGQLCGADNASLFANTPQICVSCKLKNAPQDTKVKFVWKYLEGDPVVIDEVILNTADKGMSLDLHSTLSRPYNGWPKGKYAVEVSIGENGDSPKVKRFEII